MFKTIKTWINRIKYYDEIVNQLRSSERMYYTLGKENNRHCEEIQKLRMKVSELRQKEKEYQNELKRLVSLLSGETYQEGDNMMEAIEAYQQTKYLKEHAQDFLAIMTQNAPEVAAQALFEYFELEVPDSTNIEIETAKKLYDLWMRAKNDARTDLGAEEIKVDSWEKLRDNRKEFFIQEVYKLWNR